MKSIKFIILFAILCLPFRAHAHTLNLIELDISGGYNFLVNPEDKTQLFIDRDDANVIKTFWVKVYTASDDRSSGIRTGKTYIKSFPVGRFRQVLLSLRKVTVWGSLDPYINGYVICDADESTIRFRGKSLHLNYNCGGGAENAEEITLTVDSLIKALRAETINSPDMSQEVNDSILIVE